MVFFASAYLFQAGVSGTSGCAQEATVHLSLFDSGDCRFLCVQEPVPGAGCVAASDIEGRVVFSETPYASSAPGRVLHLGHETVGTMSCCMLNSTIAEMRLHAPPGDQGVSHSSGQFLVCIADNSRSSCKMRVSARATARSLARCQLWRCKQLRNFVYAMSEDVQVRCDCIAMLKKGFLDAVCEAFSQVAVLLVYALLCGGVCGLPLVQWT